MPFESRAVQCGHSIIEATRRNLIPTEIQHPHLILCETSQNKLNSLPALLEAAQIKHALWFEPDLDFQLTAICCAPVFGEQRNFFKKFKLIRVPNFNRGHSPQEFSYDGI